MICGRGQGKEGGEKVVGREEERKGKRERRGEVEREGRRE